MSNHGKSCDCSACVALNEPANQGLCLLGWRTREEVELCPCSGCRELMESVRRARPPHGLECGCLDCGAEQRLANALHRMWRIDKDAEIQRGYRERVEAQARRCSHLKFLPAEHPSLWRRIWQPCMPGYWYGFAVGLLGNLVVLALLRMLG
jgi:hypothetical protein